MITLFVAGFLIGTAVTMVFGNLAATAKKENADIIIRSWMIVLLGLLLFLGVNFIDFMRYGVMM